MVVMTCSGNHNSPWRGSLKDAPGLHFFRHGAFYHPPLFLVILTA